MCNPASENPEGLQLLGAVQYLFRPLAVGDVDIGSCLADRFTRHVSFDVAPHEYIQAIITERGIIEKPNTQTIQKSFRS